MKSKTRQLFQTCKVSAFHLEKELVAKLSKSNSLLKLIEKDVKPHNYRALVKQRLALSTLKNPQMLQSLSSIQNQLSREMPEKFEELPDYFGPATRPKYIPPPCLYNQH